MPSKKYRKFKINKNNGKIRTVYSVNNEYKIQLKALMPGLEKRLLEQDSSGVNYAFERGKNCVEGALKHVGYKYTLSMDLLVYDIYGDICLIFFSWDILYKITSLLSENFLSF